MIRNALRRLVLPARPAGGRQGADARHRRVRRSRRGGEAASEEPIFLVRTRDALVKRRRSGARGGHRCRQRGEGRRGPWGGAAGAAGLRAGWHGAAGRGVPAGRTDGRDREGGRRDWHLSLLSAAGVHRGGGRRRPSRRWRAFGGWLSPGGHAGEPASPPPPPPSPPPHPPRARARRRGDAAQASHRPTAGQLRSSQSGAPTACDSPIRSGSNGRPTPAPPSTPGPSRSAASPSEQRTRPAGQKPSQSSAVEPDI